MIMRKFKFESIYDAVSRNDCVEGGGGGGGVSGMSEFPAPRTL